jgi:RimJ/RimL family protein N-acetyltransferase
MTTLITDRLLLRRPSASDAADALALLQDPETALWYAAPDVVDLESAVAWCTRGADWSSAARTWHGVDSADRLIVNVSLFDIDEEHATAKISYRVTPSRRRQGFAREAVLAVTDWAYRERAIIRIQLEHSEANVPSCRLARSAGYVLEGTTRSAYVTPDGVRRDVHIHGRLSTDPYP